MSVDLIADQVTVEEGQGRKVAELLGVIAPSVPFTSSI